MDEIAQKTGTQPALVVGGARRQRPLSSSHERKRSVITENDYIEDKKQEEEEIQLHSQTKMYEKHYLSDKNMPLKNISTAQPPNFSEINQPRNIRMDSQNKKNGQELGSSKSRFYSLYKKQNPAFADPSEMKLKRYENDMAIRDQLRQNVIMGNRFKTNVLSPDDSDTETEYDISIQELNDLLQETKSQKVHVRIDSLKQILKKLEFPCKNTRKFIEEGKLISILINFISGTEVKEKLYSLMCITNISSCPKSIAQHALVAIPHLLNIISVVDGNTDNDLKEQAAWAIGNLAGGDEEFREVLYSSGALQSLTNLLDSKDESVVRTSCFAISNMEYETIFEVGWILAYLSAKSSLSQLNEILESSVIVKLCEFVIEEKIKGIFVLPILRMLGNLAAGTDDQVEKLISKVNVIKIIKLQLEEINVEVRTGNESDSKEEPGRNMSRSVEKETLWVLSNLTASNETLLTKILDQDEKEEKGRIVDTLSKIINRQGYDLKKEAAYSVLNICDHTKVFLSKLPYKNFIKEFVDFINSHDQELVKFGLHFIEVLFKNLPREECVELINSTIGGIDAIEEAVLSDDEDIRSGACRIQREYYNEKDVEMSNI
ncbi:hypothetical protein BB558_006700 [Smittium angustum]|uniref:Importin subunit alpha n=1 Tax=Smittium angustum TaxID=133377 RepID=A0A2U1IX06_SMIAN|nr:hypothetical protein BB558_006700 [Smittium angustum]